LPGKECGDTFNTLEALLDHVCSKAQQATTQLATMNVARCLRCNDALFIEAACLQRTAQPAVTAGGAAEGPALPLWVDGLAMLAERGIRVYTVGIGTTKGETIGFEGWSMRVRLDEETLKNVSLLTHGEYFYAGTADDLKKVYEGLSSRMITERKETEISALFAALGALLAVSAAGLSVWWFGRVA
jgi:hypothetical protein